MPLRQRNQTKLINGEKYKFRLKIQRIFWFYFRFMPNENVNDAKISLRMSNISTSVKGNLICSGLHSKNYLLMSHKKCWQIHIIAFTWILMTTLVWMVYRFEKKLPTFLLALLAPSILIHTYIHTWIYRYLHSYTLICIQHTYISI